MVDDTPSPPQHREKPLNRHGETSHTLLQRMRWGEAEAWTVMFELYRPLVCYWVGRFGIHGADLDDLVQEVFQTVSAKLDQFEKVRPQDTFRGWMRAVTRNVVLLHFRRCQRQQRGEGGTEAHRRMMELEANQESPSEDDAVLELDSLRRQALELVKSQFEDRTWQMFWLSAIENYSPTIIAEQMNVSPAAVRKAKSRVLHQLREQFAELIV